MYSINNYYVNNELYHHGIKGMKWGVMHGPPYPLSYGKHIAVVRKSEKKSESSNHNEINYHGKSIKRYKVSSSNRNDIKTNKRKNSYHDKLVKDFEDAGYSKSASETAASNKIKTELIVGALAAVAIGVVAKKAYTAYGKEYCDKILKSGLEIQNIGADASNTFNDRPFYATINKSDNKLYKNLYPHEKRSMVKKEIIDQFNEALLEEHDPKKAHEISSRMNNVNIYENKIKLNTDVRRASNKKAREIFYKRMNSDDNFKNKVLDVLSDTKYGDSSIDKFKNDGINSKKLYDRFNQSLATPEMQKSGIANTFYEDMQKNGYNAIVDVNDTKYSGYKNFSKEPTIFFGEGKWSKISNKKINDADIDKNATKETSSLLLKQKLKNGSVFAGTYASTFIGASTLEDYILINNYLKTHKNTKLTGKEIIKKEREEEKEKIKKYYK